MHKKKIKKRFLRKINGFNLGIAVISICVGFFIANIVNNNQPYGARHASFDEITRSTNRIADAFELYNKFRFP